VVKRRVEHRNCVRTDCWLAVTAGCFRLLLHTAASPGIQHAGAAAAAADHAGCWLQPRVNLVSTVLAVTRLTCHQRTMLLQVAAAA
jgi:hypothetical protein